MKNKSIYFLIAGAVLFAASFLTVTAFSEDLRESRLNSGLKNTDSYAYILMKKAEADPARAKALLLEAAKYAPNFPLVHLELAHVNFSFSQQGIFQSLDFVLQGLREYRESFWWLRSITALSFVSLIVSFVMVLVTVTLVRIFTDISLLSHDMNEDRKKIFFILMLIPLSFLGPLFFIAGALFFLGMYFEKSGRLLVYGTFLFLLFSPLLLHKTNVLLSSSSPEVRAVAAVNESRGNRLSLDVLGKKNDFVSQFSFALALKREGRYDEALKAYQGLLSMPQDPMVHINIGNCYVSMGNMQAAKESYKKSLEIKPLASAYYNLSQLSREMLEFEKGEEYFQEAVKLDRAKVASFTAVAAKNPNRFVADETLPLSAIWDYADSNVRTVIDNTSNPAAAVLAALALSLMFYLGKSMKEYRAYRCKRCNVVLCGKCAKELQWGQMCPQCYKSVVKLEGIDPRVRVAKLLEIQKAQSQRAGILKLLSFAPPGIVQIYAGRILTGSVFLWIFLFPLMFIVLDPLISTGLNSFSHRWLIKPGLILMGMTYLISVISVRRKLNRGWL